MFDLVYYGGFDYQSVLSMPVFERDFYHKKIAEEYAKEQEFRIAIHGAKKK